MVGSRVNGSSVVMSTGAGSAVVGIDFNAHRPTMMMLVPATSPKSRANRFVSQTLAGAADVLDWFMANPLF